MSYGTTEHLEHPIPAGQFEPSEYDPPIRLPHPGIRLLLWPVSPVIRQWLNWRRHKCVKVIPSLGRQLMDCKTRDDLQQLLGSPLYAVCRDGQTLADSGRRVVYDRREVFYLRGIRVDIYCQGGAVELARLQPRLTRWDIVFKSEYFRQWKVCS